MLYLFICFAFSKVTLGINDEHQFINWMRDHGKIFIGDEYHLRLGIYLTNLRYIQEFNRRKGINFRLSANKFACYTPNEYKNLLSLFSRKSLIQDSYKYDNRRKINAGPPESFDWRDHGAVNAIKDQGQCASGYAFSFITSSETCNFISTDSLFRFSEQNIIDCSIFCHGCNGGYPQDVFSYVMQVQKGKLNLEADYPYSGVAGTCNFDDKRGVGEMTHCAYVNENDENDLKERVAWHGVAVSCITANNSPFMLYQSGILDDDSCVDGEKFDHCVGVVGYGVENGIEYWIVRNSWGANWGEEGYVRMIRNKGNKCGIASQSFVIINYNI